MCSVWGQNHSKITNTESWHTYHCKHHYNGKHCYQYHNPSEDESIAFLLHYSEKEHHPDIHNQKPIIKDLTQYDRSHLKHTSCRRYSRNYHCSIWTLGPRNRIIFSPTSVLVRWRWPFISLAIPIINIWSSRSRSWSTTSRQISVTRRTRIIISVGQATIWSWSWTILHGSPTPRVKLLPVTIIPLHTTLGVCWNWQESTDY